MFSLADRYLKGSTRCPCRVQHVPKLQTPSLELFPQCFMIAIQCMRQRNMSAIYQAWLAAGPAMRPDLGDLPPLPKDTVDVLLRICSPSFDLPTRVSGLAAIRTMASGLLHFGETCTHPTLSSTHWIVLYTFVVSSTSPFLSTVCLGRC